MRYLLLSLFIPLFSASTIDYTHYSPSDGLIAYYSFDHCDARDDTNQGSDGILNGNITCRCGVENNGLYLNGQEDFIEFRGRVNKNFNTTDFSLSFYFKPGQYMIYKQSLISKRDSCNQNNILDINLDMHHKLIQTDVYETSSIHYPDVSPEIEAGDWYHFALVRKGVWLYSYVNGVLQKKARRCSGVDIANEAYFAIGNSPCVGQNNMQRFKGVIDEMRVFDRALSEFEIAQLYARFPVENAEVDCVS